MPRQGIIESLAVVFITLGETFKIFFHQYCKQRTVCVGQFRFDAYLVCFGPLLYLLLW